MPVNSLITDAILLRKWQRRANKNSDILVYYSASIVNLLTKFRDDPSLPFVLTSEDGTDRLFRNVVITHNSAVLSYLVEEVWNHHVQSWISNRPSCSTLTACITNELTCQYCHKTATATPTKNAQYNSTSVSLYTQVPLCIQVLACFWSRMTGCHLYYKTQYANR
jgi:hypothetical protein